MGKPKSKSSKKSKKLVKKAVRTKKILELPDAVYLTKDEMKRQVLNQKCSSVSGKRRRKVMKRLRRQEKQKNLMEVEQSRPGVAQIREIEMQNDSKSKKTKKSVSDGNGIDMELGT